MAGFFDDGSDRIAVPGGTGTTPYTSFFDDPNAPASDGGITPGGGFNEKGTPDAPAGPGLLDPYPYQFNPNAPGGGSLQGGGGNYQNTPEGRQAFLSQFSNTPWFNGELFDSYLQSHPDWTQNTDYWSGRLGDAPGTGSNAGGSGGGSYAALPGFSSPTATAQNYGAPTVNAATPFSFPGVGNGYRSPYAAASSSAAPVASGGGTPSPGPGWVQIQGGGWVPPDSPLAAGAVAPANTPSDVPMAQTAPGVFTPQQTEPGQLDAQGLSVPLFHAPSYDAAAADPGYQFSVKEGQRALENAASAKGLGRSGGTDKALINYGQQAGATQYQNVYNRALSDYTTNTGTQLAAQNQAFNQAFTGWQGNASNSLAAQTAGGQLALGTNQLNSQNDQNAWQNNYQSAWNAYLSQVQQAQFGANYGLQAGQQNYNQAAQTYGINQGNYYTGQQNQYNGLMGVAGLGANATNTLNGLGSNYAGNAGNIYGQQGNAAAGGITGAANATNSGLAGVSNAASFAGYLAWLNGKNGSAKNANSSLVGG